MFKRIISTFFVRGLVAVMNLLVLLFAARGLGSGVLGQVSLIVLNISLVQILNEIYTGASLIYFVPRLHLRKAYFGGVVWTLVSVLLLNGILYLIQPGDPSNAGHGLVLSFCLTLHAFHMTILLGKEKLKAYNFLYFLQTFVLLLVLLLMVFYVGQRDLDAYLVALYAAYTIPLLFSSAIIWRLIALPDPNKEYNFIAIVSKGLTNQLGNLCHTLSNRFSYYVIGASAWLGVYANSTSLVESIWIISGSAAPIVLSHMANSLPRENNSRLVLYIARICFVLSLFCVFLLYLLPNELFIAVLGSEFSETKNLMLFLSPGVLAISFSTILSHFFSGQGQQRIQLFANSAGLLCTLLLSHFLISNFGLRGACLTASFSYFVQALILGVMFFRREGLALNDLFRVGI